MADINIEVVTNIEGLDELEEALTQGSKRAAKKFLRNVEKKAARVLQTSAELNAPIETGRLETDIHTSITTNNEGMTARVGPSKASFYALFQEFGAPEENVPATHWLENSAKAVQNEVLERYYEAVALGLEDMKK